MSEASQEEPQSLAGIWYLRAEKLQARLTRLQGACVEALDWAHAQDEERRPEWVARLELVLEEQA
jgi:hypothetical protein